MNVEPVVQVAKANKRFQVHEKDLSGHMKNEQAVTEAAPEESEISDPQVERAIDLLKTWRVFSRFHEKGLDLRSAAEQGNETN